ncbi:patatin-like phospholipase family protein [Candidatus Obscuribacterales bacterium]|nr:patatin-like phospholipase family protein [Candidatus Obscuribacterales bacterium]MBX3149262.1 patatin-like phospholipase family protein [Candidatus Obscuribacterales bacterium]
MFWSKSLIAGTMFALWLSGTNAGSVFAQETDDIKHKLSASNEPKLGLVLGGGGARGAAHVGVLKILEQNGIHPDYIVGTNVGAIVGGLYSAGISIQSLEEMFTKKSLMNSYLTVPLKVRLFAASAFSIPRMFGKRGYDGLYTGNKLGKFLNKYVPESERDISDLKIPFGAVALNLLDGKTVTLRSGNLGSALQASCALPILRKPVRLNDGLFVDGGVVNNLPVSEAKNMGADVVIAINLDDSDRKIAEKEFSKIGTVSHRVVTLHLKNVDKEQQKLADIVLHPDVEQIGLMSTSSKDAVNAVEAGERAALDSIDKIRSLLKEAGIDN